MRTPTMVLSSAVVLLAFATFFLSAAQARYGQENEGIKAAQAAAANIQKLADVVNDPVELKKQAAVVAGKFGDLTPIMWALKPRDKGGLGVGPAPGTAKYDGIELELLYLAKKPQTADQLTAEAVPLQRMADLLCGVAEVTALYGPKYTNRPGGLKRWNALASDMSEWAHELIAVVKDKDSKNFQKAVGRLNQSCNDCHGRSCEGAPLGDVRRAADVVNDAAQLKDWAEVLVRRYALDETSSAFKPRNNGGLGVGAKPGAIAPDGIEAKLLDLAKTPPAPAELAAQAVDLGRMAEVTQAVAEATPAYAKEYASNAAAVKRWDGLAEDMKKGSDELAAAVKGGDAKAVQKAANNLNQSCNDCHTKFRDN